MFKFFKEKLKSAIDKFSKDVDKESEEVIVEEPIQEPKDEKVKEINDIQEEIEKDAAEEPEEVIEDTEPSEEAPEEEEGEPKEEAQEIPEEPIEDKQEEEAEETPEATIEKQKLEETMSEETADEEKPEQPVEEEPRTKPEDEVKRVFEPSADEKEIVETKPEEKPKEPPKQEEIAKEDTVGEKDSVEKKGFFTRMRDRVTKKEEEPIKKEPEKIKADEFFEVPPVDKQKETDDKAEERAKVPEDEKKGFFKKVSEKVTRISISESRFNDLFWELEIVLLENNVAVDVIEKIKRNLKYDIVSKKIKIGKTQEVIMESLTRSIYSLFDVDGISLLDEIKRKKPYVILFVGVNGVGKTTTIAKVANMLQKNNKKCVIAAADTFRAAAIQQLEEHADKLGTKLIKHDYGSDPAAVAFDAIKYAKAKDIDVVLVDTAGRQHSNINLMEEMKKMGRVAQPDLKIFVGESITGNDCIIQAQQFNESVGIDGIILSKADVDDKGGAAISISYVTKKPILYLGTGQDYDSLKEFDKDIVIKNLGLA